MFNRNNIHGQQVIKTIMTSLVAASTIPLKGMLLLHRFVIGRFKKNNFKEI